MTRLMRLAAGSVPPLSTTVRLSADTDAMLPMRMPLANNANVLLLTVAGFSDSENVTTTCALRPTSPDPSAGVTLATSGGVVSATAAVTKEADANPFELPIRSWTPVTCTEMLVLPGNGLAGVNVTVPPLTA